MVRNIVIIYQIVNTVIQAGGTLRELLGRQARSGAVEGHHPQPRRWASLVLLVADFGIFSLAFLTWGWPRVFVLVYGLLFLANCVVGAALIRKWAAELSALGKA